MLSRFIEFCRTAVPLLMALSLIVCAVTGLIRADQLPSVTEWER